VTTAEAVAPAQYTDQRRHSFLITPDHDLLVELNTRVQALQTDLQTKVNQLQQDLALLRSSTASNLTVSDHENRLRKLERYYWMGVGFILAAEIALRLLLK
jgi:uncharacterized protein YlxW (UPF0749 family)